MTTTRVGQVRPSQLLHTYGPGSLVDLPHLSVLVAGLDAWVHSQGKVAGGAVLGYRQRKDGRTVGLLEPPGQAKWGIWTCPMSLREVEAGVNLHLADADPTTIPDYEFPPPPAPEGTAPAGSETTGNVTTDGTSL